MKVLKCLFTPIRIGEIEVRNRIVMSPMSTNLGTDEGFVTPALIQYFEARARGGVGLIVTGDVSIDPKGRYQRGTLGLFDDQGRVKFAVPLEALDDVDNVFRRHFDGIQGLDERIEFW